MTAKACAPSRACHGSSWAWCMQRWTLLATWATNGPALPRAAPAMAAMWNLLTKSLSVLCGVWPLCVRRALYRWARAAGLSSSSVTKLSVAGFCLLLWARALPFLFVSGLGLAPTHVVGNKCLGAGAQQSNVHMSWLSSWACFAYDSLLILARVKSVKCRVICSC